MKTNGWIPVCESSPPDRTTVVVCQSDADHRVFAGWLEDGTWYCHWPEHPGGGEAFTAEMGDLRATDFWLGLPQYPAKDCVYRIMRHPA